MTFRSNKGAATLAVVAVLGLIALGGWGLSKTKLFHGESKRAAQSAKTTEELVASTNAQGAAASAYFTTVGNVADTLPDSREKDFIVRGTGIGLSYLPKPDPQKLLEAERLKNAVLSGQLELANSLTAKALQRAEVADQRTIRAISAKRESDLALQEAAAETRGAEQQAFWLMILAGVAFVLWAYTKITHLSPGKLATIVTDIRSGGGESDPAILAIDSATTPLQQMMTKANYKLGRFVSKVTS